MISHLIEVALPVFMASTAIVAEASAQHGARYRTDGPDAEHYVLNRGYSVCKGLDYIEDKGCRVA